jgi:hypothetical protein
MFINDPSDSQQNAQFTEPVTPKWLRQDVGQLLLSANMFDVQQSILKTVTNEMESDIYMLAPLMKERVLTESNCRLAVHLQLEGFSLLTFQLREQL